MREGFFTSESASCLVHLQSCRARDETGCAWRADMDPLVGLALAHAEQAPVHHLERISLEVDQNE